MSKIDQYANARKKSLKEHKIANWGGIKIQLVTRGILQAAQLANFAKLLRISNDAEMVSLPGIFNLLMRAFPNDQAKQRDIKNAFIKSFGSDSVVGDQGKESFKAVKESDLAFLREVEGDPSLQVDGMIDHIVKSASLIKSATATGIYDTEGVITSLNTLMGDINKVVSLLSAQGDPQPAPGEEQPGGENPPPEEGADEAGLPDEFKDFLNAT